MREILWRDYPLQPPACKVLTGAAGEDSMKIRKEVLPTEAVQSDHLPWKCANKIVVSPNWRLTKMTPCVLLVRSREFLVDRGVCGVLFFGGSGTHRRDFCNGLN